MAAVSVASHAHGAFFDAQRAQGLVNLRRAMGEDPDVLACKSCGYAHRGADGCP